jgi:hypothetical protein
VRAVVIALLGLAASLSLFFALYHWSPERGPLVWVFLTIPSMIAVIVWQGRSGLYECPHCGEAVKVGLLAELVSPHVWSKKSIYCPKCDKFGWGKALPRKPSPKEPPQGQGAART